MNPISVAVKGALALPACFSLSPDGSVGLVPGSHPSMTDFQQAVSVGSQANDYTKWMLGSLVLLMPYGTEEKKKLAAKAGISYRTLMRYAEVAKAFPKSRRDALKNDSADNLEDEDSLRGESQESLRGDFDLTFTHYKAVLGIKDSEKQDELLKQAWEEHWSTRAIERMVANEKKTVATQKKTAAPEPKNVCADIPAPVHVDIFASDPEPTPVIEDSPVVEDSSFIPANSPPLTAADIFGDSPKESTPEPSVDSDPSSDTPEPSEGLKQPVAEGLRVSLSVGSEFEIETEAEDLVGDILVQANTEEEILSPEDMPAVTDWESGEGTEWHEQYPFHTVADGADGYGRVFKEDSPKSYEEQCRDFLVLVSAVQKNVEACPLEGNYPYDMIDSVQELQTSLGDLARNLVRANAVKTA
jgi:hypothetical protein